MTSSYILVYSENVSGEHTLVGVWFANDKRYVGEESIGLRIRQGMAGFTEEATWNDLVDQLEAAGFRREDVSVADVMRLWDDVVRIAFWKSGEISCQWLTEGRDDTAASTDKPIVIPPPQQHN